jgi:palmitoyl-protein thioesterase
MHGVLASKENMAELKSMLELNFKIDVYNMEIGNGVPTSIFTPMETQLQTLCNEIYKIDALKNGFNFIGMSQGGLLARGYVEYCNKYPVINLITLASPNGGVYYKTSLADNYYEPSKQESLSISNYWRDPYRYDIYLSNSTYLAQLN